MEAVYMVKSAQNGGLEVTYENLIVAMFEQAIMDCRYIIYGQNIYKSKELSLPQKKQAIEQVFRELRKNGLLDYVTEDPEAYIGIAEKEIFREYDNYARHRI